MITDKLLAIKDVCFIWFSSELPTGRAGSWSPYPGDVPQYFEIFLFWKYSIRSVTTQGAADRDNWVTEYEVMYQLTASSYWHYYTDDDGNVMVS